MSDTLRVRVGHHSYSIDFGNLGRLATLIHPIAKKGRLFVITNPTILRLHGSNLRKALTSFDSDVLTVPDGEPYKTLAYAYRLHSQLIKAGADRSSVIVAFGGGVIGDLAGFVAATYMRGIPWVMIPTTLLAMSDSSVGGKVAVNHPRAKNLIGAFHQPHGVFIDFRLLRTLSEREFLCGLAEVTKYGLAVDRSFFSWLQAAMPRLLTRGKALEEAVRQSCRLKARLVSRDEKDSGPRMLLNFGHTFAHALERLGNYRTVKHGEAVWLGMLAAAHTSFQTGLIDDDDFEDILMILQAPVMQLIETPSVQTFLRTLNVQRTVRLMTADKKSDRGHLRVVLLQRIGQAAVFESPGEEQLRRSLQWMKTLVNERIRA